MKDENLTAIDHPEAPREELLANLTPKQKEEIRQRVLEGIAEAERGEYAEYVGRAGLKQLTEDIKSPGRERMLARGIVQE